ncbi:MAG TPA: T9SS type A sorting domain-containing protein [Rhodothermales bacterium]|nr:T9SS type A sorting domain-containing protein [Rhodothermales bacterium]
MKRASLSACIGALLGMLAAAPAFGQVHFSDCTFGTGNNATILLPASVAPTVDGRSLQNGDEIAAFAPSGECVGAVAWTGQSTALTVWGDDPFREGKQGLLPGEPIALQIWSASSGVAYSGKAVALTYSSSRSYYRPVGTYAVDAIYLISTLSAAVDAQQGQHANDSTPQTAPAAVDAGPHSGLMQNFPNPFAQNTTIGYALASDAFVQIEVVDLTGKMVDVLVASNESAGYHEIAFDAQALPSGVYLCRFASGGQVEVRRMLLTR